VFSSDCFELSGVPGWSGTLASGDVRNTVATSPDRVNSCLHPSMKRRIWPLCHCRNIAMFDWIVVYIVHVARIVAFVSKGVFPETTLLYPPFASGYTHR
jgi:hypothetical protein